MSTTGLHESADQLSAQTIDEHRGYRSLIEELEAIDWYNQRVEAATDSELARVLTHSRDEEKEHASMTLEWLRRQDPTLDEQLRKYLFSEAPLPLPEGEPEEDGRDRGGSSLAIGSLRGASTPGGL